MNGKGWNSKPNQSLCHEKTAQATNSTKNIKIPTVILIAEQYKSGSSIFTTYY